MHDTAGSGDWNDIASGEVYVAAQQADCLATGLLAILTLVELSHARSHCRSSHEGPLSLINRAST